MVQPSENITHAESAHSFELTGNLSACVADKAKFELLLAMHASKVNGVLHFEDSESNSGDEDAVLKALNALNFYPPMVFSINQAAVARMRKQSESRQKGDIADAWFRECASPTPIHYKNDDKAIAPNVIENCRYYTQHNLRIGALASSVESDPTLLHDIVPVAQGML